MILVGWRQTLSAADGAPVATGTRSDEGALKGTGKDRRKMAVMKDEGSEGWRHGTVRTPTCQETCSTVVDSPRIARLCRRPLPSQTP